VQVYDLDSYITQITEKSLKSVSPKNKE
jgi:hypothetical protein